MVSSSTKFCRRHRKRMRKYYGGVCKFCGTNKKLEFAHIKENGLDGEGRGSYIRIKNIMDNPDCYGLMCHSCHIEFDRKARESSK